MKLLAVVACCGVVACTPAPKPEAGPPAAAPRGATVPPRWATELVTEPPVGFYGLAGTPHGPVIYVAGLLDGVQSLARPPGWQLEPISSGATLGGGMLAMKGDTIAATAIDVRVPRSFGVRCIADGRDELVAGSCDGGVAFEHQLLVDSRGPLVVMTCNQRLVAYDRSTGHWRERFAVLSNEDLVGAAVDGADHVHLLLSGRAMEHRRYDGASASTVPVPADQELVRLDGCKGQIFGVFAGASETISLGTFEGDRWSLDPVDESVPGPRVLGFDDACHPMIAAGRTLWSRAAHGWTKTAIDLPRGAEVRGVVRSGDRIYVAYEEPTKSDGIRIGIVSTSAMR